MPAVSVILPTRDRPELLPRAVQSVLAQSFADLELVVIDNNRRSPPLARDPAFARFHADPRVRLIPAPDAPNAAAARNRGLAHATGAWITFLDDDDFYQPDKVAAQLALARATAAPLVLCGYEFVWLHRRRRRQVDRPCLVGDEILTGILGTPALFHPRDDTLRFDERLDAVEDLSYALELLRRHPTHSVPVVARPLVVIDQTRRGPSVHANKEAVWLGTRAAVRLARSQFSPRARRRLLARAALERARGGHGGWRFFLGSCLAVLRAGGHKNIRTVAFALRATLEANLRP